jgi:hypothetical protein
MIASRKILKKSLRAACREVVMRTYPLLVKKGRETDRVPTRRVTMMDEHRILRRRRN